ncbi:MAG TPA: phosphodiester glycosidase family protein [Clostridia bacterium]|nr:phosphodiester glycosidase family protein [Clostridia bacterium]
MAFKSVYGSKWMRSAAAFFLLCAMLLPAVFSAHAEGGESGDLTPECKITLPERSVSFEHRLTDARYNSRISFEPGEALAVSLADGAKGLYVAWYAAPEAATLEFLDGSGKQLGSAAASTDLLNEYVALPEGCKSVRISGERAFAISELGVYDAETAPDALCVMQAQPKQPKVMLIAAMTSDESFEFGSLLPYLSGDDAALVFLSYENRQAQQEAIRARYAMGSRTQPIFGNFPYYPSAIDLKRLYSYVDKGDATNWLIGVIRRYQPDTLITHATIPEGGIGFHALAAVHTLLAATQAADDGKEYVSERAYGVWQVRAVYQHVETGTSPLYDTAAPLSAFGGESALSLAQAAYDNYSSLRVTHYSVNDTPYFVQTYPAEQPQEQSTSELFALLSALKGPAAAPDAAATPKPSETPEPEATAQPADEAPQPESASAAAMPAIPTSLLFYIGAGVALLGVIIVIVMLAGGKRRRESGKRGIAVAGLLVGVLLLLGGAVLVYREMAALPAVSAAPAQTVATPVPSDTPQPEPSAALDVPEPADESEFASHFRKASDPAEVVVFDEANGIYEYRNDVLAIEIRRTEQNDPPLAYYIAHIYMRDIDSYRSGFGSVRINGRDTQDACVMAREYKAVLGMTGDNLLHSDYNRGMMMRDGRIFRSMTQVSLMALTEDLSMRIYNKKDANMLNEIEEGTQDTFAFGPPLILDGVLCADVDLDRVGRINPRAGLGLVEPGHYVAIVADGRLPHYSHGMMLSDFAKLFLDEGCVMAYNLDGGASATLVFMGEYINKRAENHYRSVPDQLLWGYSELVPGVDDPYTVQGLVPQDWRKGS